MRNAARAVRQTIGLRLASLVLALSCGCHRAPPTVPAPVEEHLRNGKVVLGSPRLTSGIPGSGPLTNSAITSWLAVESNHRVIDVILPASLATEQTDIDVPGDNPLTPATIELGRQLFFDKRLSGLGTFSCATCHQPRQSFSSYQVMPEVGRNASAVFNRLLASEHFWDGRAQSLEQQPASPVSNPFEMNSTPEKSTANIRQIAGYRLQFEKLFGEVSFENICKALACFERAIVTGPSAWDEGKLLPSAARGAELFFSSRLACSDCHVGSNFTDEDYHNLGTSNLTDYEDIGRQKVTEISSDQGSFKTPSLRNVALTPPYMHNGSLRTLEEVIDFFDRGGDPSVANNPLKPLSLTDVEKQDLVEFLKSLTSPLPPVEQGRLPE